MRKFQRGIQVSSVADDGNCLWIRDGIHGGVYKYNKDEKRIIYELKDRTFAINTQERLFLTSSEKKLFLVGHQNPNRIYIWDKEQKTIEDKHLDEVKGRIIGVEYIDGELVLVPHSLSTPIFIINIETWEIQSIKIENIIDDNKEAWDYSRNKDVICATYMGANYILLIPCAEKNKPKILKVCGCTLLGVCVVDSLLYALTSDGRILVRNYSNDVVDEIKIPNNYCANQNFVRICGDVKKLYFLPIDGNMILTYEIENCRWATITGTPLLPGFSEDKTIAQYWYWYRWKEESVLLPFRHSMIVEHGCGQNEYQLQLPEGDLDIQLKDNYRYVESMNGDLISIENSKHDLSFFLSYITSK